MTYALTTGSNLRKERADCRNVLVLFVKLTVGKWQIDVP